MGKGVETKDVFSYIKISTFTVLRKEKKDLVKILSLSQNSSSRLLRRPSAVGGVSLLSLFFSLLLCGSI